jgi:ERCC4-related helicase
MDGSAIAELDASSGLPIPPQQLLPFFLAARSAINPRQDLLGEALCSSYEAFRLTRQKPNAVKDEQEELPETAVDLSHSGWYLEEFDRALERCSGATHPKVDATVRKVVDLWEAGEKVLVFAFYRHTCRALHIHISGEIDRRLMLAGQQRLREAGRGGGRKEVEHLLARARDLYFDRVNSPGRRAVDAALAEIIRGRVRALKTARVSAAEREVVMDVMRKFLRAEATLVRCFPLEKLGSINPGEAVTRTLNHADASGLSWRHKFDAFIDFLTDSCSSEERKLYLEAAQGTWTGRIRVESDEDEDLDTGSGTSALANVQVATGKTKRDTRARLMRAFNTPFFPDILVCSEVMGEGVDLQRSCRHVIHHDLAWNPSTIEQRTGRVDRLGCKAEGRHPIVVFLPYLAGTADERQYRVMCDREKWFRVVMGQDEVARLITEDSSSAVPLPSAISDSLSFKLGLDAQPR